MPDTVGRSRPEPLWGKPAVLNGRREYAGKVITKSILVEEWEGQQYFWFEGFEYKVVSSERSGWNDQNEHAGLWTMTLTDRK